MGPSHPLTHPPTISHPSFTPRVCRFTHLPTHPPTHPPTYLLLYKPRETHKKAHEKVMGSG